MKYKAGQMVMLTYAETAWAKPLVGSIKTLKSPVVIYGEDHWYLDPPLNFGIEVEGAWSEDSMTPIRDQPGADETLTWAGKPEKVAA